MFYRVAYKSYMCFGFVGPNNMTLLRPNNTILFNYDSPISSSKSLVSGYNSDSIYVTYPCSVVFDESTPTPRALHASTIANSCKN